VHSPGAPCSVLTLAPNGAALQPLCTYHSTSRSELVRHPTALNLTLYFVSYSFNTLFSLSSPLFLLTENKNIEPHYAITRLPDTMQSLRDHRFDDDGLTSFGPIFKTFKLHSFGYMLRVFQYAAVVPERHRAVYRARNLCRLKV
jgi:hypothetical protein